MLAGEAVTLEELSDQQWSCLRDLVAEIDWTTVGAHAGPDGPELPAFGLGLRACAPEFMSAYGEQSTPVTVGESAADEISHAGEVDYFVFEAESGQLYQIDVTLETLLDSVADLYGPDGFWLAGNDNHTDTAASRIYWQALSSGSHYVAVEGLSEATGTYTVAVAALDVVDDHPGTFEGATPVTVGEATAGEIQYETDEDLFVFEAEQSRIYQIDITLGTLPDADAILYGPDGDWKTANDDKSVPRLYWQAQTSGNLYVAVEGLSEATGTYTVAVAALDVVDDHPGTLEGATPVTVGEATAGEIQYETDEDLFVFEAEQGRIYQIDITLGTLPESLAWLYDPDEGFLKANDDISAIYWQAQTSGSLYVLVNGWFEATGTYTVAVTALDVVDDHPGVIEGATAVAVGDTAAGDIQYVTDADYFVFEAEQGQLYQIDVTVETLSNAVATLYDPYGDPLAHSGEYLDIADSRIYWHSQIYWQAQASGSLYVAVEGWSEATGTYTFAVATSDVVDDHSGTIEAATPVAVGDTAAGDIQYETDIDYFVFEAELGQTYQIDITLGTLPESLANLRDPDGLWLVGNDDTSAPRLNWQAQTSGSHYVRVAGWPDSKGKGTGTGTYTLTIITR